MNIALLHRMIRAESRVARRLMAPVIPGGKLRVRVQGMVRSWRPDREDFEGWGIFRPTVGNLARFVREASPLAVEKYLDLFPRFRMRLAYPLKGNSWLAFPLNESDMRQRLGRGGAFTVHLVNEGSAFDVVDARWDGAALWYAGPEFRADPVVTDYLVQALAEGLQPQQLHAPNLTPDDRLIYDRVWSERVAGRSRHTDLAGRQLEEALHLAGGQLVGYRDRGGHWFVTWRTATGEIHNSAIAKDNLNVISAGICLDGGDSAFDLQSLVGVVEKRPDWTEVF
ncbi:MAG: hypothetical protein QNK37_10005 [Acidobacteriota bacterium]|nr:hypothetical protein [Acidobacteriota bacterium]